MLAPQELDSAAAEAPWGGGAYSTTSGSFTMMASGGQRPGFLFQFII